MNRFTWEKGELDIADSQCQLCDHWDPQEKKCRRFEEIPQEVITNEKRCPGYERKGPLGW